MSRSPLNLSTNPGPLTCSMVLGRLANEVMRVPVTWSAVRMFKA